MTYPCGDRSCERHDLSPDDNELSHWTTSSLEET